MTAKDKMAMQLQKTNGNMPQAHQPVKTIADYIKAMTPEIAKALPSHMRPERLARIVTTEIRRNPKLMECTRESLLGALMLSAQLGLEPGPLGHCYYIPFANRKTGVTDCQFLLGYRGMIDLARRSGNIESIMAETVYENDTFEFEYGLNPNLIHKPNLQERGKSIAWYAVAKFKDGGYQMKVMGKGDIEKARSRSMTGKSQYSPWATDYDAMAKKTVIRDLFKYLPVSNEIMRYSEKDAVIKKDISEDEGEIYIDIEPQQTTQITVSDVSEQPTIEMPLALMDLHRDFPEEFRTALKQLNIDTITDEHVEPIKKRVNMILDEQQAAEMIPE